MPVFLGDGVLVGYSVIKAHWLDIGAKDPYSTDTVDLHQEGTIFPGVKLFSRGQRVEDIYRLVLANSRVPKLIAGDLNAQIVGVRAAADALVALVSRFGLEVFRASVERMFDHGEAVVRSYFEQIPDGRYVGEGTLDNDGITDEPVPFEVVLEVEGSTVRLDYSGVPDQRPGPINCPIGGTVSASRLAISALAGGGDSPHEGQFRPLEVVVRPGSMFCPIEPAPSFLYVWPAMHAIEAVYHAVSKAMPEKVPAGSGGCLCGLIWWGRRRETDEPWADGAPHPIGQGAHNLGDGGNSMMHITESTTRFSPVEVWEAKNPWLVEKMELAPDSCGPGRFRGGLGVDLVFQMTEDAYVTSIIDRTKNPPYGLQGGLPARPNHAAIRAPDGSRRQVTKATRQQVLAGGAFELRTGGGGGFGPPAEREPAAVLEDIKEGYISEEHARRYYPHAFD
jgi:N-methylhydantoinase B